MEPIPPMLPAPDRLERRAHAMIATMSDAGNVPETDRRGNDRARFLAQAQIHWTDASDQQKTTLFTRDLTHEGVGFIANGELAPAARGTVEIPGPGGKTIEAEAKIVRTQSFANGWQEGFAQFTSPIDLFSDQPIRAA